MLAVLPCSCLRALIQEARTNEAHLLDLPWIPILCGVAALLLLALSGLGRWRKRPGWMRSLLLPGLGLPLLAAIAMVSHLGGRMDDLQQLLDRAQLQIDGAQFASFAAATPVRPRLFDLDAANRALGAHFAGARLRPLQCNDAIDLLQVHFDKPMVEAWLAVVDLRHDGLRLVIDGNYELKTLTSDFARRHDCALAINGEAGASPRPHSGLGAWQGHVVAGGVTLLQERPGHPLPFLAFDAHNRASYRSSTATERTPPADAQNVICGRVDCLVGGVVETAAFRFNQPRTVMGIDQDGARLYLLVVDGRQIQRSYGFTRAEAGWFLQAFGASDAMLCDEGGSSCMYVARFGGIVNVPSDDDGVERPMYSHFGLALQPDK